MKSSTKFALPINPDTEPSSNRIADQPNKESRETNWLLLATVLLLVVVLGALFSGQITLALLGQ